MSPLWRGFAGLVAVLLLAYYATNMEAESEQEIAMIMESDPSTEALKAFEEERYFFYERYFRRIDPESGADIGYWILHGDRQIAAEILDAYPNRVQIKTSLNYGLVPEHQSFNQRVRRWVLDFNLKMAELLSQ